MQATVKHQNLFNILVLGPLVLAPFLSVEFPRILAYLPVLSAIMGAFVLGVLMKQKITFPKNLFLFLVGVLLLSGFSALWASAPEVAGERVTKLCLLLPFYGLFVAVLQSSAVYIRRDYILSAVLISCALGALLICVDLWLELGLHRFIRNVAEMEFISESVMNRGAVTIVLLSLIPAAVLFRDNKPIVLGCLTAVILMTTQVESQTAQIALVGGAIFYFVFPFSKSWAWVGLFCAFVLFVVTKPFAAHLLYTHMATDLNALPFLKNAYIGARLEIWDYVGRYAMQNPILGQGIEVTRTIEDFDSGEVFNVGSRSVLHPHSFVLQIWMEFGAMGIALMTAVMAVVLKALYKTKDIQFRKLALTSLMTSLLIASFSYGIWQSWFLGLFCLLGAVLIIARSQVQPERAQNGTAP